MMCEICKNRLGELYEYEYRIRHRRTLICFCIDCLYRVLKQRIQAPAHIPDNQVAQYIIAKEKENGE